MRNIGLHCSFVFGEGLCDVDIYTTNCKEGADRVTKRAAAKHTLD